MNSAGEADATDVDGLTSRRWRGKGSGGASGSGGAVSTGGASVPMGTGGTAATATGGTVGAGGSGGAGMSPGTTPAGCPDAPAAGIATYYVCDCAAGADKNCVAGNDGNAGTSPSTPWQTVEKAEAQFAALRPGDRIEFCRGGRHVEKAAGKWVNSSCKANNRCVVASYTPPWASGDEGRPVIHAPSGISAFDLSDGGNADHEEGYVFAGLEVEGEQTGVGYFFFNDIDSVLICDNSIHDFELGVQTAEGNTPNPGADMINADITVRDSYITNNNGQGFLGGENNTTIQNNHFQNNGSARANFNHNLYIAAYGASNITITGNDLYQSTMMNGKCEAVSLVAHGVINGMLIANNTIHEDVGAADLGCWGIAVDPGYATTESFTNVTIRANTVTNMGNESIGVASCQGCVIEDNVVINQQKMNYAAIQVPGGTEGTGDVTTDHVTIRNNSLDLDMGIGIQLNQEGAGHIVVNNAVYNSATATNGLACFNYGLPSSAYQEVDHNDCYQNGKGEWALGQGALATWTGKSGFDQHSTAGNPAFASINSPYDLRVSSTSPLFSAGDVATGATTNMLGVAHGPTVNIGAY